MPTDPRAEVEALLSRYWHGAAYVKRAAVLAILAHPAPPSEGTCLSCGAAIPDPTAGACHECGAEDRWIGSQWLSPSFPRDVLPLARPAPPSHMPECSTGDFKGSHDFCMCWCHRRPAPPSEGPWEAQRTVLAWIAREYGTTTVPIGPVLKAFLASAPAESLARPAPPLCRCPCYGCRAASHVDD